MVWYSISNAEKATLSYESGLSCDELDITPQRYTSFVQDQAAYQRDLALIKWAIHE